MGPEVSELVSESMAVLIEDGYPAFKVYCI